MDDDESMELLTLEELLAASRYSILIRWSDEDGVYIADVPELPGVRTHGSTAPEAADMAHEAAATWISMQWTLGRDLPAPRLFSAEDD